jgi:hypothetical protein
LKVILTELILKTSFLGPDFVGSFIYREHVYFWYREKAAESVDNNNERHVYSRVARVCQNDRGGMFLRLYQLFSI